jgi:hypothetical protein
MMLKDSFSRFVKGSYAMYTSHMSRSKRAVTVFPKQPETHYQTPNIYLRMELALRLRASALVALASATRLARTEAYSF